MSGLQTGLLHPSTAARDPPGGADVEAAPTASSVQTHGAGRYSTHTEIKGGLFL